MKTVQTSLFLGLIFLSLINYGQEINFGLQVGYGNYKMTSLQNLTQSLAAPLPSHEAAIISEYPPNVYLQAEANLTFIDNKFSIGMVASVNSTGSRVHYSDYSGSYRFDAMLSDYTLGSIFKARLFRFSKIDIKAYSEFGFSSTTLTIEEYFQIDSEIYGRRQSYDSSPAYLEPGLRANYSFGAFELGISAGYAINIGDTFTIIGNEIVILANPYTRETIVADWSGLRLGITASFRVFTLKDKK